jgi:hypothetical protein
MKKEEFKRERKRNEVYFILRSYKSVILTQIVMGILTFIYSLCTDSGVSSIRTFPIIAIGIFIPTLLYFLIKTYQQLLFLALVIVLFPIYLFESDMLFGGTTSSTFATHLSPIHFKTLV